ncbi:S-adenosyl-L-methionine-dependent methyltransferase [Xylogone sp. PMI_703]|nr:S-adenosyl-L-methionine-dependent methyltransferase [Xylogone sp. PMI_703]
MALVEDAKPKTAAQNGANWSGMPDFLEQRFKAGAADGADKMIDAVFALGPSIGPESRILDIGTGPGTVTGIVRQRYPHVPIVAVDFAPAMVAAVEAQGIPGVTTGVADATDLDRRLVPDASFTHIIAALVIQFCGERQINVLTEMHRALIPGGVAGASISKDITIVEPWHKACASLDPTYPSRQAKTHEPGAWMTLEELEQGMKKAGFVDVHTFEVSMQNRWDSADQFMQFWFSGKHPSFGRIMAGWKGDPAEVRPVMEEILKEQYGDPLTVGANAGIVLGRKPA